MQWWYRGHESVLPQAEPYIRIVHEIATQASRRLQRVSGVVVEDKGPTLALHYRAALDQKEAIAEIEQFLASTREVQELTRRNGKMVIELRPPVEADKGTALSQLATERGIDSIVVLGDDHTDLDGFNAAREFGLRDGNLAKTVAVLTSGTPLELVEAADFTLDDTDAVEEFLTWLAGQV
jgi:trehalose 6-phosphate phosphatase